MALAWTGNLANWISKYRAVHGVETAFVSVVDGGGLIVRDCAIESAGELVEEIKKRYRRFMDKRNGRTDNRW